jgi:hypothetical protein
VAGPPTTFAVALAAAAVAHAASATLFAS